MCLMRARRSTALAGALAAAATLCFLGYAGAGQPPGNGCGCCVAGDPAFIQPDQRRIPDRREAIASQPRDTSAMADAAKREQAMPGDEHPQKVTH